MVSTNASPNHAYFGKLTRMGGTTGTCVLTSAGIPGFVLTSVTENPVRIPLEKNSGSIVVMMITDAASSAAYYAQLDVRYANKTTDPGYAGRGFALTSTVDAAFQSFISTAVIGSVTASEHVGYMIELDTAPFACNFGGTSSAITDAYESFIEVYPGQSTKATVAGHNTASAVFSTDAIVYIGAYTPRK